MLKVLPYEFIIYCKNLALAKNSIKELNRYIRQFDEYLQENDLSELSQLQYKQLVAFIISNEAKPITIKARIWAMKKFFSFLYLNEYIEVNIAKELSPPKIPKKETRFLTGAELEIVFKHLGKGLKKAVEILKWSLKFCVLFNGYSNYLGFPMAMVRPKGRILRIMGHNLIRIRLCDNFPKNKGR